MNKDALPPALWSLMPLLVTLTTIGAVLSIGSLWWVASLRGVTKPSTLKLVSSRNLSGLSGLGVGRASCAKLHIVNTPAD